MMPSMVDDLDLTILSELAADSSVSIPKLSKKIDVNSSVVYSRIRRLVGKKIIKRFTIDISDAELGYGVKALVGLTIDSKMRGPIVEALFAVHEARQISEVTGRFDMLVTIHATSLGEMHHIVEEIGKIDGVIASESFIEMKTRRKDMPHAPKGEE